MDCVKKDKTSQEILQWQSIAGGVIRKNQGSMEAGAGFEHQ
jgi:hypothetical protein